MKNKNVNGNLNSDVNKQIFLFTDFVKLHTTIRAGNKKMELSKISFNSVIFNSQKNNTKEHPQQNHMQRALYPMPDYRSYISFKGGKSLDLKQTMTDLLKPEECPPGVWERAQEVLAEGNPQNKTLIDIHKEVYDDLHYVSSIEELREFFVQFKDVKSAHDIKPVANSFLDHVKKGELEHFNPKNDTSLDLVQLLYAEGFSRSDLLQYTNNVNISGSIKGLNIPVLNPHYAQVLKLSDKEFNERITRTIAQNKFENADRKAQQGEPVYIPSPRKGQPLSAEHRAKISEALREYWAQNPEKIDELSARQKTYFEENPEQAELFSLVVTKTWGKSPSIIKALSKHFKKCGAEPVDEKSFTPKNLSSTQRALMKEFWNKNPWAKQMFSENMKAAWEEVRTEDKYCHTIKLFPDEIVQKTIKWGKENGIEYEPQDFETEYRRKNPKEVITLDPKATPAVQGYLNLDEKESSVISDVWGNTVTDLYNYMKEKIKKDKKISEHNKLAYEGICSYSEREVLKILTQKRYNEKGQPVAPYATAEELYGIYGIVYALCIDSGFNDCTDFMNKRLEENYRKFRNNPTYKEVVL